MDEIKGAGWTRFKPVAGEPIAEQDMKRVFKMVDMDNSGAISQLVIYSVQNILLIMYPFKELKLAVKYLGKRYGISNVPESKT